MLAETLEAKIIIEGLLYSLAAFTANHEISDEFCLKCVRLGQILHNERRCTCICHRAREWVRAHGGKTENLEHDHVAV